MGGGRRLGKGFPDSRNDDAATPDPRTPHLTNGKAHCLAEGFGSGLLFRPQADQQKLGRSDSAAGLEQCRLSQGAGKYLAAPKGRDRAAVKLIQSAVSAAPF